MNNNWFEEKDFEKFDTIIHHWDTNPPYKTGEKYTKGYRKIFMDNWPDEMHYEFIIRKGQPDLIGIEFHDGSELEKVNETTKQFNNRVVLDTKIKYEVDWRKHPKLKVFLPINQTEKTICKYMAELITLTKSAVDTAYKSATQKQ